MPSCWVKIEVSAPLSSASSIMRGPAIGVAVGVEPAPEAPFALVEPLSSGDCEESTAKTPPTTSTNKSRAAANSKRRLRFPPARWTSAAIIIRHDRRDWRLHIHAYLIQQFGAGKKCACKGRCNYSRFIVGGCNR